MNDQIEEGMMGGDDDEDQEEVEAEVRYVHVHVHVTPFPRPAQQVVPLSTRLSPASLSL